MRRTALIPLKELSFPIQYLEICQSLVRAKGGDFAAALLSSDLHLNDLLIPTQRINGEQLLAVYAATLDYCHAELPYVLQVLAHFPITAHGLLGVLALTSAKLEDALNAAIEFFPLLMPAFSVQRMDTPDEVHLLFRPTCSFGRYDDFFAELIPLALCQITPFLSQPPDQIRCYFRHQSLFDPLVYKQHINTDVQFNARANRLVFSKKMLNTALLTQSISVYNQAKSSLQKISQASHQQQTLTTQIRQVIREKLRRQAVMNTASIARSVHLSERTLARHLAQEGQTIMTIKNEVRLELAQQLLRDQQTPISEIASQLGFSNTENFTRYFKQMTGKTPRQFKQAYS